MKLKSKKIIVSLSTLLFSVLSVFIACFCLVRSDTNMNLKQGLPELTNGVIDFTGYDVSEAYVKQHMKGEYEFFYNRWIVEENDTSPCDAKVSVPHHYKETEINGKRLSNEGYSSYRVYVKGLPVGTKVWFINNNFVGGFYAYINKELVVKYGTRAKRGNCMSNGGDDMTKEYVVKDTSPLEVVFEVSSSYQGGLTSPARLVINTLGRNPTSQYLTNNIGFFVFGIIVSLLVVSFVININVTKRDFSFSLFMIMLSVMTFFSIDVYWRILSIIKSNTYNPIIFINQMISLLLSFSLYYHLTQSKKIKGNKWYLFMMLGVSCLSILLYFLLMGTFYQVIPLMLTLFNFLILLPPLSCSFVEGKKLSLPFLLIVFSLMIYFSLTFFDLENIMIAGLEQSISYIMIPLILIVIVLYRISTVSNTKRYIHVLEEEKKLESIKIDVLKEQIQPHFIFNCLTSIQGAYKEDRDKGEEMITMFSKHLRSNLEASSSDLVPFEVELNNILNYVSLENLRKEKGCDLLLDLEAVDFSLPPLTIEPFVENAIQYSKVEEKEDGYISLSTRMEKDEIIIEIEDNGVGFDTEKIKDSSIGLKNAKERLHLTLHATVHVTSRISEGTKVSIAIPLSTKEKKS